MNLWHHQEYTVNKFMPLHGGLDMSDPGCVDADTEYLSPTGWRRIADYKEGLIGQFDPVTHEVTFVEPYEYTKLPCTRMIAIEPVRGTSQRLSHEHRVLFYTPDGEYAETSAAQFMTRLHKVGANHNRRKFASTFNIKRTGDINNTSIEILRLMVAVIADGHFGRTGLRCTIRLKKRRKIERLRALLVAAGITYVERACASQPGFQVFRFDAPWREKFFGNAWWATSDAVRRALCDEIPHWDGSVDRRTGNVRFCSTDRRSSDFVQYAFASTGHTAALLINERADGKATTFDVHVRFGVRYVGPGRADSVYEVDNPEGFKYCFGVETTYWIARRNGYIFATGNTGKTAAHLALYARRAGRGRCLVTCPSTLMESAWAADIDKFFPQLTYTLAYAENRFEAFEIDSDIVIMNLDGVKSIVDKYPRPLQLKKFLRDFDHLIMDEVEGFKHASSQRSRAANKIARLMDRKFGLSATPNPQSVTEMWHPALLVDGGKRLGTSFSAFRNAMQTPIQVGPGSNHLKWVDQPQANEIAQILLKDILVRHEFEEVMPDVPPNHVDEKPITLPPKLFKLYSELEATMVALLESGKFISVTHASSLRSKLLQLCSGALYAEGDVEGEGNYVVLDPFRYQLVADLVEERPYSVTFFNWKHQRIELEKQLKLRKIAYEVIDGSVPQRKRGDIVKAYQAGQFQTLLVNYKTGAHGLTLTRGTTAILVSPIYEPNYFKQTIHRIYRGGQTEITNTLLICAKGTVEELVYEKLRAGTLRMQDFLAMVAASREAR